MLSNQPPLTLPQTLEESHELIRQLFGVVEQLQQRIEELEEQINQYSGNSSQPPSKDKLHERTGRSGKPKSARKRGAQKGHRIHRRALLSEGQVDVFRNYYPEGQCSACGGELTIGAAPHRRHQVFNLPAVKATVTEHRVYAGVCADCEARQVAAIPSVVPSGQMDAGLISWITLMHGACRLSIRQVQTLLIEQWQLKFSVGAISQAMRPVSSWLQPLYDQIGRYLRNSPVVHADETPHYRGGELRWLWVMCNTEAAYFMTHYSRSKQAANTLLDGFCHYLVSDRLGSYLDHPPDKHQYCWAHVIRNLEKMTMRRGKAGRLGRRLVRQLRWCVHLYHQWQQHRQTREDIWRQLHFLQGRIRQGLISALGWKQAKGKDAFSKTANQCQQLLRDEVRLWCFLQNPGLPLTNNEAERALRAYVIFRKTSFFSQSARGDQFRPLILSLVETCKRQKIPLYPLLRVACSQGIRGDVVSVRLPLPQNKLLLK